MLVRAIEWEDRLPKTIVVVGLDEFNLRLMRDLPGADDYDFLPVLGYDEIVRPERYDLPELLRRADELSLESKRAGKNQITFGQTEGESDPA